MIKNKKNFTVVKDVKEQLGWQFGESDQCKGMIMKNLPTGDYTIVGSETKVIIERKGSLGEFSRNICEDRFYRELERLNKILHPYLLLEFDMETVHSFPINSGIPSKIWPQLKISSGFILKKLIEIETNYPRIKILFVGNHGEEVATAIFKRIIELDE